MDAFTCIYMHSTRKHVHSSYRILSMLHLTTFSCIVKHSVRLHPVCILQHLPLTAFTCITLHLNTMHSDLLHSDASAFCCDTFKVHTPSYLTCFILCMLHFRCIPCTTSECSGLSECNVSRMLSECICMVRSKNATCQQCT